MIQRYGGTPRQLGEAHGEIFRDTIRANVRLLVDNSHRAANKNCLEAATAWARRQSRCHCERWPWLGEEIRGIARGSGVAFEKIEQLNFRIWQYGIYGAGHACSNFIGTTQDGVLLLGGTLDDPRELYGFVEVAPDAGHRFMTFLICGTVWGSRGINDAGLALGVSSLTLGGLRYDAQSVWQQDICLRLILQQCASCEDVIAFCRQHLFTMNFIVADAAGNSKAFTCSPLGVWEYSAPTRALTNHLLTPLCDTHLQSGWNGEQHESSVPRLARLNAWLDERNGSITLGEAKSQLCRTDGAAGELVNNANTAFVTIARPQFSPSLWVAEKPATADGFREYSFA